MSDRDFLHRDLPVVGKSAHRVGLAFSFGIDGAGTEAALAAGINYLFWGKLRKGDQHAVVKAALKQDRERYVLATGPWLGYFGGSIRRWAERTLRSFDIEYIDVFQLFWLGKAAAFTPSVQTELVKLREEGLVRAIGVSIHDRKRAGRLVDDSPLDMLMVRYNAAHPGAEKDIFPGYEKRRPLTVAYTATSWRKLLKRPKGWDGPVMSAGDCYRFCLTSPHVDVVLCGPKTGDQLNENLEALKQGPLSPDEVERFRRFGRAVHG